MHLRTNTMACITFGLVLRLAACDDKPDATSERKSVEGDATKTDVKTTADMKPVDPAAVDGKADDGKADDGKADDGKADDGEADDGRAVDDKADDGKADEGDADEPDTKKPADPKPTDTKKPTPPPSGANGKELFEKKCKTCHGANGNADTKIGKENEIADWTQPGWKAKWSEAKVVDIVTKGKSGTKMKPFADKLPKDEIAAVSKYARSLGK